MKLPRKDQLRDFLIEKKKWMILIILVVLGVLGACIFIGVINTPLTDPLTSFQAPSYVPEGYVSEVNNSTTGVDKSFTFTNENKGSYFIVAAIKDTNKSEYSELVQSSLYEETEGVKKVDEEIVVDGHSVKFNMLSIDLMGMHLNMFHASWICPQTGLNIVTAGQINPDETENMKKMITTIQCHTEKQKWKIPKL